MTTLTRGLALLVLLALLAVSVGACGSSLQQAERSPQVQRAEQLVQTCIKQVKLSKGHLRDQFFNCIAPPGKKEAVQRCAQAKFKVSGLTTPWGRKKLVNNMATCLVRR